MMNAEDATKLLSELVMATIEHDSMKHARMMLDASEETLCEDAAKKMAEIEQHALETAKSTVQTLLFELLGREATQSEVDCVTAIAVDSPKPRGSVHVV